MSDDEVTPSFAELAAESPEESLEREHDAVDRVEQDADAVATPLGLHDERDLMPEEDEPTPGLDFGEAMSSMRTVGDPPPPA